MYVIFIANGICDLLCEKYEFQSRKKWMGECAERAHDKLKIARVLLTLGSWRQSILHIVVYGNGLGMEHGWVVGEINQYQIKIAELRYHRTSK